jgi:hypothetical protein
MDVCLACEECVTSMTVHRLEMRVACRPEQTGLDLYYGFWPGVGPRARVSQRVL